MAYVSGYAMVPSWLLEAKPSGNAVLIYVTLASFGTFDTTAGVYQECRPSLAKITDRCGLSESTVKRAVSELLELGAIERTLRWGPDGVSLPTLYQVIFGRLVGPGKPAVDPGGSTPEPRGGSTGERVGGPPVTCNPEPITQNQKTHKEPAPATQSPTKANEFVALLIEACKKQDLVLPPRIKGMYAKKFKELLDGGMPPELILEALRLSWKKRTLDKVQLLDNLLVEVQAGERVKDVRTKQEVRNEGVDAAIDRAVALVVSRGGDPNNGRLVSKAMKEIRLGLVNVGNALTGGMRQMELVSA